MYSRVANSRHEAQIIPKLFWYLLSGRPETGWNWLCHLFYYSPKTTKSRHSLNGRCAIKFSVRTFPKKSDRLSSCESSLRCGGGLVKLERRQQQQVGRQTDNKHIRSLPHGAIIGQMFYHNAASRLREELFFVSPFNMTRGKSVSDKTGFMVPFLVAEWLTLLATTAPRPALKPILVVYRAISPQVIRLRSKAFYLHRISVEVKIRTHLFHARHITLWPAI
jgi:hypothetical protein